MKRENTFYYSLVMFLFVTTYLACYVMSNRLITFGGLVATASALVYPLTYFISVLFYERYGKDKSFELINFSIVALVFMGVLFAFGSAFNVKGGTDGMESIFNTDFRVLFSSVVAFIIGQYTMIKLYDFLGEKKGFDFLIAGVIAITIDSFLFVGLGYIGSMPLNEVLSLATGQYSLNVIAVMIFAICFKSMIPTLLQQRHKEEDIILKEEKKPAKKSTKRKTTKKKNTKTKETETL